MSEKNRRHALQAFGMALLIEAGLVAGAAVILVGAISVKQALSEPVPITLVTDEPEKPAEPKPLPPPPQPQPKLKAQVKPVPPKLQAPPPPQDAPPVSPDPAPVAAVQTAFAEPAPVPPPPPPPSQSGKVDPALEYAAKVRAAVQAAHSYPLAAAAIRFSGRVRVEFHLRDAVPGEARVLVPCGVGFIDHAALQAVQSARYPEPPTDLRGRDNLYQVWVEFTP
jgi:protein TonB